MLCHYVYVVLGMDLSGPKKFQSLGPESGSENTSEKPGVI